MVHPGPGSQCVSYQTVLLGNRATPRSQAAGLTIFSHQRLGVHFFKVIQLEERAFKKRICGTPDLTSFPMAQCPWVKHSNQFCREPSGPGSRDFMGKICHPDSGSQHGQHLWLSAPVLRRVLCKLQKVRGLFGKVPGYLQYLCVWSAEYSIVKISR